MRLAARRGGLVVAYPFFWGWGGGSAACAGVCVWEGGGCVCVEGGACFTSRVDGAGWRLTAAACGAGRQAEVGRGGAGEIGGGENGRGGRRPWPPAEGNPVRRGRRRLPRQRAAGLNPLADVTATLCVERSLTRAL